MSQNIDEVTFLISCCFIECSHFLFLYNAPVVIAYIKVAISEFGLSMSMLILLKY